MMDLFQRPEDTGVGFWGARTSAVDWCEPNYTHSYYVAEIFNTITSLPAFFLALFGLYLTNKYGYDRRFIVMNTLVGIVGLGSALFHGTLLYTGQILDELPMVYAALGFLYAMLEMESTPKGKIYRYAAPVLIGFSVLFTAVYLYLPEFFLFFVSAFIGCILTLVYRCVHIFRNPNTLKSQKIFIVAAVCLFIGGWLVFWIPEVLFCDHIQALKLHAWWHVSSSLGTFVMLVFVTYQRELFKGRKPELQYANVLGVPILPYIHIPNQAPKNIGTTQEFKKLIDVAVIIEQHSPILRKKNLTR